jgi:hypothetical protein
MFFMNSTRRSEFRAIGTCASDISSVFPRSQRFMLRLRDQYQQTEFLQSLRRHEFFMSAVGNCDIGIANNSTKRRRIFEGLLQDGKHGQKNAVTPHTLKVPKCEIFHRSDFHYFTQKAFLGR